MGNSIRYNDFLGVGSNHITNDLSMALHTPIGAAEKVKLEYGTLNKNADFGGNLIELPTIGDEKLQTVSVDIVRNVIYARVEETLMILAKSLEKSMLKEQLGAGVVLTGGMTKIDGIRELASAVFDHMPVRLAKPKEVDGLFDTIRDPAFSSVIGLVLYGAGGYTNYEIDSERKLRYKNEKTDGGAHKEPSLENTILAEGKQSAEIKHDLSTLAVIKKEKKSGEGMSKYWNWMTKLF